LVAKEAGSRCRGDGFDHGIVLWCRVQRHLHVCLGLHACLGSAVHQVRRKVKDVGNKTEPVVEDCQDVEEAAQHQDYVVEPDDPVIATVRTDVALVLHHDSCGRDGAAFKPEQLAHHAELRAILNRLVASIRRKALRADVPLATLVSAPITTDSTFS